MAIITLSGQEIRDLFSNGWTASLINDMGEYKPINSVGVQSISGDATFILTPPKGIKVISGVIKEIDDWGDYFYQEGKITNDGITWELEAKTEVEVSSFHLETEEDKPPVLNHVITLKLGCFGDKMDNFNFLVNGEVIDVNEPLIIEEETVIDIKSVDGWEFNNVPDKFDRFGVWGQYIGESGGIETMQWALNEDDLTEGSLTLTPIETTTIELYNCSAVLDQVAKEVIGGVNNVYLVNPEIITELTSERFIDTSSSGTDFITYDYGNYLINLLMIPYELPDVVIEKEAIKLGNKTLEVKAPALSTDLLKYDLGVIKVDPPKDLTDVSGVDFILHLPATNPIFLKYSDVAGKEIGITLEIDVYTGTSTYNIVSSVTGESIINMVINLAVDIPLSNNYSLPDIKLGGGLSIGGDNKILTPFIQVLNDNSEINKGFYSVPIMEEGKLSDLEGFVMVDNINLSSTALSDEIKLLNSVLGDGIII